MSATYEKDNLTHIEADTIGEVLNISMGAAATALSVMLNRQVGITTPIVNVIKKESFEYKQLEPAVGVEINYSMGLNGSNLMIMRIQDVVKIVGCLLGDENVVQTNELDEIHTSALGEVMNQMMGSASTALATFFDKSINISPPQIVNPDDFYRTLFNSEPDDNVVTVSFRFVVDGMIDSQFITVLSLSFVREIVTIAAASFESESKSNDDYANSITGHTQIKEPIFAKDNGVPSTKKAPPAEIKMPKMPPEPKKSVNVRNIELNSFDEENSDSNDSTYPNLDLVMGVEVNVTVEIGHAKKLVKDVLNIAKGSIIELDRQAGDPVDVIVNGQLIAKGDVVVVDDYFGVRITKVMGS